VGAHGLEVAARCVTLQASEGVLVIGGRKRIEAISDTGALIDELSAERFGGCLRPLGDGASRVLELASDDVAAYGEPSLRIVGEPVLHRPKVDVAGGGAGDSEPDRPVGVEEGYAGPVFDASADGFGGYVRPPKDDECVCAVERVSRLELSAAAHLKGSAANGDL
jgi:hypothetical protein